MGGNKNKVLLMEIVVVVLFFSISAATTLQLFARANAVARRSGENARALIRCEDWAERLMAADDPVLALDASEGWRFTEETPVGFAAELKLTGDMKRAVGEEATYFIKASGTCVALAGGSLWEMRVYVQDSQGELHVDLPVVRYDAKEAGQP